MKCPKDGTDLRRADRNGVEIDWCPECRGVWLDRGELEKIAAQGGGKGLVGWDDRTSDQPGGRDYRKGGRGFLADLFDL